MSDDRGNVVEVDFGVPLEEPPCEQIGIPKPKPFVFAVRTGGNVTLRLAYPHKSGEAGEIHEADLTTHELSEVVVQCAMALAVRSKGK